MINRKYFILLLSQICLFLLFNYLWENESFLFLYHESLNHVNLMIKISSNPLCIFSDNPFSYPIGVHYITKLVAFFFDDIKWPLFIVQTFFVTVNVIATYFCTLKITGKERAGFWAASALLWLPSAMVACRTFNLDYPLAAVLSLWILCYLYSEGLKRKVYVVWFFLLFLAMGMIKYSFVLYVAPCIAVMLYELRKDRRKLALFLFIIVGGLAVFLIYLSIASNLNLFKYIHANIFSFRLSDRVRPADENMLEYMSLMFRGWLLEYMSLMFRGWLLELKAKVLTPAMFWLFCISFTAIFYYPKRRKKYLLMFLPCALSLFFILFTENDARYQYPLLSFFCITASVFWSKRTWLLVSSFLVFFLQGIVMTGGWLFLDKNVPIDNCDDKYLYSDLDSSVISDYDLTHRIMVNNNNKIAIEFSPDNTLTNLFNFDSAWSHGFFYTIDPHDTNWEELFSFLTRIPDGSTIVVVNADPHQNHNLLMNLPHFFAYWTEFHADLFGKDNIVFSNNSSHFKNTDTPDYILQYELSLQKTGRRKRTSKDVALSEKLQKERKLLKVIDSNYYVLRLYK